MAVCIDCGKTIVKPSAMLPGYSCRPSENTLNKPGGIICYDCCGRDDEAVMRKLGHSKRLPLYLGRDDNGWYVGNWPGTLRFRVTGIRKGQHNWARTRWDVWFSDSDHNKWWGVNYGEMTQIVHCKRLKVA